MICKSCSNEIGNVKFCPHCGAQNINFISEEDSLLNRPSFDRNEQNNSDSLINNDYEEIVKEETASDTFGEDLGYEPRREVFDENNKSEYHFNEYDSDNEEFNQSTDSGKTANNDTYNRGVFNGDSSKKSYDYGNNNHDETSDKLWDFLGKINQSVNPIASKIHDTGMLGLIVLVLVIALLNRFSVNTTIPYFTPGLFFRGLLSSTIGAAILFFFNRFVFNYVAKKSDVYFRTDELNVCILLSMVLGAFISLAFGNSILIAIFNAIVSTLFLLALVRRRLSVYNYKSIGIKYVIFNILFMILFYVVFFGLAFALLAIFFR